MPTDRWLFAANPKGCRNAPLKMAADQKQKRGIAVAALRTIKNNTELEPQHKSKSLSRILHRTYLKINIFRYNDSKIHQSRHTFSPHTNQFFSFNKNLTSTHRTRVCRHISPTSSSDPRTEFVPLLSNCAGRPNRNKKITSYHFITK